MSETYDVNMGHFALGEAPNMLSTSGIGSCIAVCLYSARHLKGALAHVMLPASGSVDIMASSDYRYADAAISAMITELEHLGIPRHDLTAKIVGGANMFPGIQGRSPHIGERNIESVHEVLNGFQISIAAEDTGGTAGRAIVFDLSNGIVNIRKTI